MSTFPPAIVPPSLPNNPLLPGEPLPIESTPGHTSARNGSGRGGRSAEEQALDNYQAQRLANGPIPGGASADAAAAQPRAASNDIDPKAVLERIAGEWKQAGVNPAWIALIKAPDTWSDNREANRPALIKLTRELQDTGEFSTLRRQAMRLIRATPLWVAAVDRLTTREYNPATGESREVRRLFIEHRLVARFFGRNRDSVPDKATTLELIVNAKAAADILTPAGGVTGPLSDKARAFMIVAEVEPETVPDDEA